jgi:hypothetical protein
LPTIEARDPYTNLTFPLEAWLFRNSRSEFRAAIIVGVDLRWIVQLTQSDAHES